MLRLDFSNVAIVTTMVMIPAWHSTTRSRGISRLDSGPAFASARADAGSGRATRPGLATVCCRLGRSVNSRCWRIVLPGGSREDRSRRGRTFSTSATTQRASGSRIYSSARIWTTCATVIGRVVLRAVTATVPARSRIATRSFGIGGRASADHGTTTHDSQRDRCRRFVGHLVAANHGQGLPRNTGSRSHTSTESRPASPDATANRRGV